MTIVASYINIVMFLWQRCFSCMCIFNSGQLIATIPLIFWFSVRYIRQQNILSGCVPHLNQLIFLAFLTVYFQAFLFEVSEVFSDMWSFVSELWCLNQLDWGKELQNSRDGSPSAAHWKWIAAAVFSCLNFYKYMSMSTHTEYNTFSLLCL